MKLTFIRIISFLLFISKYAYSKILLFTTEGIVPKENFTYLSLNYGGNIILELNTKEGDADLYISEKLSTPSYELDRYDLHSATCGKDIIYIPRSFGRPIGVGIYGHGSYDFSYYIFDVFMPTVQDDLRAEFEDVERRYESSKKPIVFEDIDQVQTERKVNTKIKKILTKSGLWALLEMFEMIFLI